MKGGRQLDLGGLSTEGERKFKDPREEDTWEEQGDGVPALLSPYFLFPWLGLAGSGGGPRGEREFGHRRRRVHAHLHTYILVYPHIYPYIPIYIHIYPNIPIYIHIHASTHAPTHPHSPPRHHPPPRAGHSQLGGLAIHRLNITNEALNGTRGLSEISQPFPGACSLASR